MMAKLTTVLVCLKGLRLELDIAVIQTSTFSISAGSLYRMLSACQYSIRSVKKLVKDCLKCRNSGLLAIIG